MFILRRIDSEFGEINTSLGDYYTLISKRKNNEQFNKTVELWDEDVVNKLSGVIVYDEDKESIMPLYSDNCYYIMTSDGNTFSRF